MSLSMIELIVPGTKRTLTALLNKLPNNGVGARVVKDTWLSYGNSYIDVERVVAHKDKPQYFDVYGIKTFNGKKVSEKPQRIASVWKWGWTWMPKEEEKARLDAFLAKNPHLAPKAAPVPNPEQEAAYQLRPSKLKQMKREVPLGKWIVPPGSAPLPDEKK